MENYRILNLEGAWLNKKDNEFVFSTIEEKKYKDKNDKEITIKPNKDKLFSATMPESLETLRAFGELPKEVVDGDFTKLFVNFKFTKDRFDDSDTDDTTTRVNKKKLRKLIYTSTVKIDDIEYRYFKRGASKARTANVIFVKKDHYNLLIKPSLLGLKFEEGEEYDITSKEAYISLIMSGIIGTIEIKSEEILIIDDLESPEFKAAQSVTRINNEGNIYQDVGEFDVENNMTDGQLLMDESIFLDNELINEATCVLLRNDFFKGNAVRTRLQEYYKENNITKVFDKFGGWIAADKIKLVITSSACKYLKFADQFESEKDCFMNWLKKVPSTFGVVKIDHSGNYRYSNRLSYQMINSMNLDRDQVKSLMQDELKYFKLLKDSVLETGQDIRKMSEKNKVVNRDTRNRMSYFLDLIKSNKEKLTTGDMVADLLNKNSYFRFTRKFKDWKNEQLQDYIRNLRLGKIRIKNSLYAIMISCPYEMLVATTREDNKIDSCIMDGWECYCPRFTDNKELLVIRNPQINAGNIGCMTNKFHEEYKWFGYYKKNENGKLQPQYDFIVFVNSYNVDVMNRLQGCDWDIDSCYLSDNELLVSKAKDSQLSPTPVNGIKGSNDKKVLNNESLAELDNFLGGSTRLIGKIVNKSAIFNGYMYDGINNGKSENYIDACYDASSTLSSFSQIAIDMAKKNFLELSLTKEMNKLNKTCYVNEKGENEQILQFELDKKNPKTITIEEYIKEYIKYIKDKNYKMKYELIDEINDLDNLVKLYKTVNKLEIPEIFQKEIKVYERKMVVPYFFTYIAKDNSFRIPTKMECSMDYLEEIIDGINTKARETDKVDMQDLLVMQKDLTGGAFCGKKIDNARRIIDTCQSVINQNVYCATDNETEATQKNNLRRWAKKTAIKQLEGLELNEKTVYRILLRAFNLDKNYQSQMISRIDKNDNIITYWDWDYEEEFISIVKELKEMTMLTLTLIYNSYPESFMKCFQEKKEIIKTKRYWV